MTAIPQHLVALNNANEKRKGIATFRREVRAAGPARGALMVAAAIDRDFEDFTLGSARIGHLMLAVAGLGEKRMSKCLLAAGVHNFDRKLRDLTPRQRGAVVIQLELWARGWAR